MAFALGERIFLVALVGSLHNLTVTDTICYLEYNLKQVISACREIA